MANYQNLKAAISAAIRTNGNQEITGQVLQDVLNSIVSVIGANYTFAGVATPATNPGTPDQNVMYLAMEGGTYTNFSGMVLPAGISLLMWNGTWTSETVMCGDGGVFDISVYKSSGGTLATFADLAAALDGGNNIPASARKGGMSVKFVQSSDNKYVQYRLMSDIFNTTPANWQSENVDDKPTAGSDNLVKSGGVYEQILKTNVSLNEAVLYEGTETQLTLAESIQAYIKPDGTQIPTDVWIYYMNTYSIVGFKYVKIGNYDTATFSVSEYVTIAFADANDDFVAIVKVGGDDIARGFETICLSIPENASKLYAVAGFKDIIGINDVVTTKKKVGTVNNDLQNSKIYSIKETVPVYSTSIAALLKPDGTQTAESRPEYAMKIYTLNGGNRLHLEYHNGVYAFTAPGYIAIAFADNNDNYVEIVRTGEYGGTGSAETIETGYQITVDIPSNATKLYAVAGFDIIKEYVNVSVKEKIKELDNEVNGGILSYKDMTLLVTLGSSLTQSTMSPKYTGWVDRINNETDIPIINGAYGGKAPLETLNLLLGDDYLHLSGGKVKLSNLTPSYIMMNNQANNNISDAKELSDILESVKCAIESYGATMLMGDEELWTAQDYKVLPSYAAFANKYHIPYSNISLNVINKCYNINQLLQPWVYYGHRSWRGICSYSAHKDLIESLPIYKSIKLFRARNNSATIAQLAYSSIFERAKNFVAIGAGCGGYDFNYQSQTYYQQFAIADSCMELQYALPVDASITESGEETEVGELMIGNDISFVNYCLLEAIFDKVVNYFNLEISVSVEPTKVYILKKNSTGVDCSFEEVPFTYTNQTVSISKNVTNLYRNERKVSLLICASGDFLVSKPVFKYNSVYKQVIRKEITFRPRLYGNELLENTNPTVSFTLGSNASIITYPTGLNMYSAYNNIQAVVKLTNNGSISITGVNIPADAKKLMVRIVAQNFIKLATTKYSSVDNNYADYVVNDVPEIEIGELDCGAIRTTISGSNGDCVKEQIVQPGWNENYWEIDLQDGLMTTINITVERMNYGSFPIHIHNISIQYV